ncbi:MAG: class IV adenylate cyclase [Planctomycetota bacterium]|nr:class IV adenylate cyclase [Planctomycetota bacterium]
MPTNIEIKARVADLDALRARVTPMATAPVEVLQQEDVFFGARTGRLKLRIFDDEHGELIAYQRPDALEPEASAYRIVPTSCPAALRAALTDALGETGIVRKRREVHMVGQTRVHLDQVEGLGAFMELEVVLGPTDTENAGRAIAEDLMSRLGIQLEDLVASAYVDLLRASGAST